MCGKIHIKVLVLYSEAGWVSRESICEIVCCTICFFPTENVSTWMADRYKLWLFRLEHLRHFSNEEHACHFKENNWQYLLPIIQGFKQKLKFWKTFIYHDELDSFSVLLPFSFEIGGNMNECIFKILYNESKFGRSTITHWTSVFQMISKDVIKVCMGKRSIQRIRHISRFWCNTVPKIHWYSFRFHIATNL